MFTGGTASGNMKLISIISVNYNQREITEAMLASIFQFNTYQPIEIIVVDNASADKPVNEWKTKYPTIKFIASPNNSGFAGGNNLGIAQAKGEYLFLVNNDTEFTPGLLNELASTLDEHPEAAMVSPKIRYYDHKELIQYAGFTKMNYLTARNSCVGQYETDRGQYDKQTGETAYIHGAAMLVRREAIDNAGLMEENYFLYYEEMDWCEKMRRAGYKIMVNMQALIYHKESVTVGAKSALKEFFMNRNRILFIRRNATLPQRLFFYLYFISVVTPRNILSYISGKNSSFIPVLLKAILWNLTNPVDSKNLGYPVKR